MKPTDVATKSLFGEEPPEEAIEPSQWSKATSAKTWSEQQNSIFKWFAGGSGNLVVRARAGTGKTTTICEGINHAPEQSIMLAAFNVRIAKELNTKLRNPYAEAKTLHSIGFSFVRSVWPGVKTDNDRGWKLAATALRELTVGGRDAPNGVIQLVAKLATLGKEVVPFAKKHPVAASKACPDGVKGDLTDLQWEFDLLPEDEVAGMYSPETIEIAALKAMEMAAQKDPDNCIDFSDMIYLPLRNGWVRGKWNLVCIDEAQDMNASQLMLALGACKKGGRVAIIGDDRQAIYGFRGADSGAIDRMKVSLKAEELGLTTTYRCPKLVVELAQRIVPDFHAAPSAPQGTITNIPDSLVPHHVKPGDFVLSRTNAPLVKTCLAILRSNIRAKIEGRDIGKGLANLVKKLKPKSIPHFLDRLRTWEADQIARVRASTKKESARETKMEQIHDQAETLAYLAEGMKGVPELEQRIYELFDDAAGTPVVVCSTVHRAKGLESNRVFILRDTLRSRFGQSAPGPGSEEKNIEYVAITRSKSELIWVDGPKKA